MNNLSKAIAENENVVYANIMVNGNLVAELQFEACDITYADDREIYIRYAGTDVTIPMYESTIVYDEDCNTYEIDCDGLMEVDITFAAAA